MGEAGSQGVAAVGRSGSGSRARRRARRAAARDGGAALGGSAAHRAAAGEPHGVRTPATAAPGRAASAAAVTARLGAGAPASGRAARRGAQARGASGELLLLKLEACEELGLTEKVRLLGWGGLSAAEAGRVGAYITRARRERGAEDSGAPS